MRRIKIFPLLMVLGILFTNLNGTIVYAATEDLNEINIDARADREVMEMGNYGVRLEDDDETTFVTDSGIASYSAKANLPASYRNKKVPAIRNQSSYGTCWAFTSVGLAELDLMKDGIAKPDFSELHLAYFNYKSVLDPLGGLKGDTNYVDGKKYNYLTLGGDMAQALYTFASWKGTVEESNVSYSMAKQSLSTGISESYCYDDVAHLQNAYIVDIKNDPNAVKKLIMEYGGVGINYADSYKYYNSSKNCYYSGVKNKSNHAVIIVGWDDNFSKNNFSGTKPKHNGAWLIRNSWGKNEDCHGGYFWLSYDEPSISAKAYAFDFVYKGRAGFYNNNYQYDGSFANSFLSYARKTVMYANVFKADSGSDTEILKAVGVRFCNTQAKYRVDIYTDLTDKADPTSGELVSSVEGVTEYEGFYTIKLDQYVVLNHGQKYSVVVTQERGAEETIAVSIEGNYKWSGVWVAKASAQEGQSFIKSGLRWNDCGKLYDANVRVKAYTDDEIGSANSGKYRIEYELNGGTQNPANPVSYTSGKNSKLYHPSREGMNFEGWYLDSGYNQKVTSISKTDKGNIKLYAKWKSLSAKDLKLGTPKISSSQAYIGYIQLNWKKAANAEGYYIYRRSGKGSWKKIATLKNAGILVYYDEAKKTNGTSYDYKITAYAKKGGKTVTKDSSSISVIQLDAPKISSFSSVDKTSKKLKFGRNKKASGYEIEYSTSKKYSKGKKVKISKNTTTSATIKNLKAKKKYYIRIRSYKKVGKKTYYGYWKEYYISV